MKKTRKTVQKRRIITPSRCFFCEAKKDPNYLEVDELKKFVTERGRILNRNYSGICSKHQKRLAVSIKRARHLSLLPFKGII